MSIRMATTSQSATAAVTYCKDANSGKSKLNRQYPCPEELNPVANWHERNYNSQSLMKISARNQLSGHFEKIILGQIMTHVTVPVADNLIESVITRRVDALQLRVSDEVKAVVKSTEVILQKD